MMTTESFVYKQRTFELNDTAGQLQALHDDGFALIPNVLSADEVATARAAIDRLEPFGFDALGATDHYKCVFNRDVFWLNMLDRAGVVDLAEAAMGKECPYYWSNGVAQPSRPRWLGAAHRPHFCRSAGRSGVRRTRQTADLPLYRAFLLERHHGRIVPNLCNSGQP
jgi:hypothetical protein